MELLLGVNAIDVTDENGKTVNLGDVAIWNHTGTATIPPRPFARMAMEEIIPKNKSRIQAFMKNSVRMAGNKSAQKQLLKVLMTSIGQQAQARAKKIVTGGETVSNAPRTIQKKGFNKPLFETGTLAKNIVYKVEE